MSYSQKDRLIHSSSPHTTVPSLCQSCIPWSMSPWGAASPHGTSPPPQTPSLCASWCWCGGWSSGSGDRMVCWCLKITYNKITNSKTDLEIFCSCCYTSATKLQRYPFIIHFFNLNSYLVCICLQLCTYWWHETMVEMKYRVWLSNCTHHYN